MPDKLILFVCSGNVCRSPMAEYLLRRRLPPESEWKVESAGVSASLGMPATDTAFQAMRDFRIDMEPHKSKPLDEKLVEDASLIVAMTVSLRDQIISQYPAALGKVYLLKSFDPKSDGEDVSDPIGSSLGVYRRIRDEIAAALPGLLSYMKTFR